LSTLITGGTGFLGSYLARYLVLEKNVSDVVILDRYLDRARLGEVADQVTIIEGDVCDLATLRSAIDDHGVSRIAHYAFLLGGPLVGHLVPYQQVQCGGTANVLEAARAAGVERMIFASSVAAYGARPPAAPGPEPSAPEVLTEDQ
jgi:UDP-glucose 4-epimerase